MSPDAMMMVQNGAAKESSYRGEKARVQKSTSLRVPSPMPLLETRVASPMPSAVYTRAKETNVAAASHVVKQAQQFLEANVKAWMQPNGQEIPGPVPECSLTPMTSVGISHHALLEHNQSYGSFTQGGPSFYPLYPPSPYTSPYYLPYGQPPNAQQASAAASFFARAAQKLNLSSRKKRRHHLPPDPEPPPFVTNFNAILQESPPAAPPALLRSVGRRDNVGLGKVKVMLRITPTTKDGDHSSSFLSLDSRKKQVTVFDPSVCGYVTPEDRRAGVAAPKMFAFDAVFSQDDSQTEVCCTALTDVIQAVVNGNDGCLFCYGHSKLGKTYTMIGNSGSVQTIGAIPCAISWLFKLINEQKQKTGARFSVRVSAVEISGKNETLKDLLSEQANGTENSGTSPGIYLREDPIFGAQLQNQSELRVPTVEKAAYYLDAAITARTNDIEDEGRNSHMLFTLHVYQYRVDKSGKGGVAGGRSRLHLLDLGSCDKQGKGSSLTLSAMANVILAILYGQKHVPFRDSKLTQLLREILGSLSCNAAMIAHVSPSMINYSETLSTIQFAARIHRLRRKKLKYSSQSSGESSCDDIRVRKHLSREDGIRSSSDPDHTSSSEQSCDTVIYVGPNGTSLSDRELTDNESPPVALPIASKHIPKSTAFKTKLHPTSFLGETPIKEIMKNSDSQVDHSTSVMNGKESSENDISKKETRAQESSHSGDQNRSNSVSTNRKSGKSNSRRSSSSKSKHSGLQGNAEKHSSSPSRMMLRTYSPLPMSHLPGNSVGPKSALWSMDSEEQWIDGPRVRKAWFEAQSTLHRQEMWVDGPPPMYGYMDKHKREMIQRWLDFQSSHVQRLAKEENEVWIDGRDENSHPKREKHERKDIDLHGTNLKCNSAKPSGSGTVSGNPQDLVSTCINEDRNISNVLNFPENIQIKDEKFKYFSNGFVNYPEADISKNLALAFDSSKQTEETLLKISHPPLQNSHTDYSEIHSNKINDGAEEPLLYSEEEEEAGSDLEADLMYNHRVERCEPHNLDPLLEESEEDLSPEEPIMQDSCLQVTEEDILAACMEFNEDHPLRILSEENLASSFADTFSVDTDLRTPSFQESESEAEDDGHLDDIPPCATIKLENMSHYSLPVYAMHFSFPKIVNQWTEIGEEENSICSEPAPYGYKQIQPRTLKSTHTNITTVFQNPASGKWNIQEMIQVTSSLESKFIKTDEVCAQADSIPLKTNQYKDLEELSCLRHPDGASNPNLHEELLHVNTELPKISKEHRSPGNGASNSDAEDKACTRCSCSYTINQDHNLAKESQCFTEFKPENEPQCSSPRQSQLSRLFGKKTCCSSEKTHSSGCKSFHQNTLSDCDSSVKLNYSPKSSPKNNTRFSSRIPVSVKCIKEISNKTKDAHKCNKSPLSSMCLCSRPTSPQSFRKKDEKDSSKTHCKKFCQGTKIPCSDKKHSKRKTKNDICQSSCVKQGQRFIADLNSENSRGSPASEKLGKKGTPVSQHASGTSSGYESMLRDSEGSGSSSDQESASEASDEEDKDKYKGETLNLVADRKEGTLPTSKILNLNDIFELKEYDEEDVERIEKRRMMEETLEIRKHRQRVLHLRMRQEELRRELSAAKNRLMLEPNRWSYDLHVEESMDIDDPSFLEVLERETQILEKRVVACKSHIMMVTCFDANL